METIAGHGAPILYLLTDPTAKETILNASWVVRCQVASGFLFDTYALVLSVIRLLSIDAFRLLAARGRNHLKSVEEYHESLEEFE